MAARRRDRLGPAIARRAGARGAPMQLVAPRPSPATREPTTCTGGRCRTRRKGRSRARSPRGHRAVGGGGLSDPTRAGALTTAGPRPDGVGPRVEQLMNVVAGLLQGPRGTDGEASAPAQGLVEARARVQL